MKLRGMLTVILITFFATLVAVVVFLNFSSGEKKIDRKVERLYNIEDPDFKRAMGVLLGPAIVGGNRVEVLLNGDRIFPSMIGAIRSAKKAITFESYIYWSGEVGKQFADALVERASAGVKVHVLLDWAGSSKMEKSLLDTMEKSGVQIQKYHKPHWYNIARMNNRTHRKLLVVDGALAFTGGVGISDLWSGDGQDPKHWRDTHFRIEGPVVAQMQSVFLDNWIKVTGAVLHGPDFFPELKPAGGSDAQMFSSSPAGGSESMHLMYLMAITAARTSIDLSSAYFVPDELSVGAFVDARKRGVKVRIITPGPHTDTEIVKAASRGLWGKLLEAGVEIHEYQPTMYHCKVMVVDALMVSVGSTNFDNRSFSLNDEANLNIYDAQFAREQAAIFENDLKKSRRMTLQEWLDRPLRERASEKAASLLHLQL